MTPHKWAKEIKAWADGTTIQYRTRPFRNGGPELNWTDWYNTVNNHPEWNESNHYHEYEYRIKPTPRTWWFAEHHTGALSPCCTEKQADELMTRHRSRFVKKHKYTEPE